MMIPISILYRHIIFILFILHISIIYYIIYLFVLFNLQEFVPFWGVPTDEAWTTLGKLVELFLPTTKTISCLEGEKYITQSLILLQLCLLEKTTNNLILKCMPIDFLLLAVLTLRSSNRSKQGRASRK